MNVFLFVSSMLGFLMARYYRNKNTELRNKLEQCSYAEIVDKMCNTAQIKLTKEELERIKNDE